MNFLHPIKLMYIFKALETNPMWVDHITSASSNLVNWKYPDKERTRAMLCSPQVAHVLDEETELKYYLILLAFSSDNFRISKNTYLELYNLEGNLIKAIPHSEWSTALSLAIETALLEILLNINPW